MSTSNLQRERSTTYNNVTCMAFWIGFSKLKETFKFNFANETKYLYKVLCQWMDQCMDMSMNSLWNYC